MVRSIDIPMITFVDNFICYHHYIPCIIFFTKFINKKVNQISICMIGLRYAPFYKLIGSSKSFGQN